jgi:hypothetical protein
MATTRNGDVVQIPNFKWSKYDLLPFLVLCRFLDGGSLDLSVIKSQALFKRKIGDLKKQLSTEGKRGEGEINEGLAKALTTKSIDHFFCHEFLNQEVQLLLHLNSSIFRFGITCMDVSVWGLLPVPQS